MSFKPTHYFFSSHFQRRVFGIIEEPDNSLIEMFGTKVKYQIVAPPNFNKGVGSVKRAIDQNFRACSTDFMVVRPITSITRLFNGWL
jgi:hypothetical protein